MPLPLNSLRYAAYLALGKKYQDPDASNVDIAMAFAHDGTILGYGKSATNRSPFISQSPMVNLLQNIPKKDNRVEKVGSNLPIAFIACTYLPGERDLGMARLAMSEKIKSIVYFDHGNDDPIGMYARRDTKLESAWNPEIVSHEDKKYGISGPESLKTEHIVGWIKDTLPNTPKRQNKLELFNAKNSYANSPEYNRPFTRIHTKLTLPDNLLLPGDFTRVLNPNRDMIFMNLAWAIVGESIGERDPNGPYPDGHLIGSVLRGPNDEILAWGLNTNKEEHWSLHGEVNLIQTYQERIDGGEIEGANNIESRPILYTTLEPCHMCAGMYKESGTHVYCYYGQKDPGIKENALAPDLQKKMSKGLGDMLDRAAGLFQVGQKQQAGEGRENADHDAAQAAKKVFVPTYNVTGFLDDNVKKILQRAIHYYFDLVPNAPASKDEKASPERTNWTNHKTPESYIWENGLKLLHHINSGVLEKWKKREDRYYQGVID